MLYEKERRTPRFPIRLPVRFLDREEFGRHVITNISEGGLFVRTPEVLSIGSEVEMEIVLGAEQPIAQRGTVTWIKSDGEAGMGVAFQLPLDKRLALLLPSMEM